MSTPLFENRGIFWQYPGYLDVPYGPWCIDRPRSNENRLKQWKMAFEWMAERGVKIFIGKLCSQDRDWEQEEWGFHYICQWDQFPEARVFSRNFVDSIRGELNELFSYARTLGIKPYIHHYNFFATMNYVEAHRELYDKLTANELRSFEIDGNIQQIVGHVCWLDETYQEFMKATWREVITAFPDLAGFLATAGERNNCSCDKCTGGVGVNLSWNHTIRIEHIDMLTNFVHTYVNTVRDAGAEPLMRIWHGGDVSEMISRWPKGVPYVSKLTNWDLIDCGPEPNIKEWQDNGHTVWVAPVVSGNENGGPILSPHPEIMYKRANRAKADGIQGFLAYENPYIYGKGYDYRPQSINLIASLKAISTDGEYNEQEWIPLFDETFGGNGHLYLKASKLYSRIVLDISKVLFSNNDGFAHPHRYFFRGEPRWPGVMGPIHRSSLNPPRWAHQGEVTDFTTYIRYLDSHTWRDDILPALAWKDSKDPVTYLREREALAAEGIKMLESIPVDKESDHLVDHKFLLSSARYARAFASIWAYRILARVQYAGVYSPGTAIAKKQELAQLCVENLKKSVIEMKSQLEFLVELPTLSNNFIQLLNGKSHHFGWSGHIKHWENQTKEVEDELKDLIEGNVYVWPTSRIENTIR